MAGPAFPVDDQTDEDFFDKLVDDEVGSDPGVSDNVGGSDVQAFAKLSVDEVDTTSLDGLDGEGGDAFLSKFDGEVEGIGGEDGGGGVVGVLESAPEVSEQVGGGDSGSDSRNCGSGENGGGGGIKQVQWSAFGGGGTGEDPGSNFFGVGSEDPFADVAGGFAVAKAPVGTSVKAADCSSSYSLAQNQDNVQHVPSSIDHGAEMQDQDSSQYWDNLYPGWGYDPNTGQWYQVNGFDATTNNTADYNTSGNSMANYNASVPSPSVTAAVEQQPDVYYLQRAAESVAGSETEEGTTTGNLSYWNQTPQGSTEYPAHMVFDSQYPGYYYDTTAQEWRSLESYLSATKPSASVDQNQQMSNGSSTSCNYYSKQNMTYGHGQQVNNYTHEQDQLVNWRESRENNQQQDMMMARLGNHDAGNTHYGNGYMSNGHIGYSDHGAGVTAYENPAVYEQPSQGYDNINGVNSFEGYNNGVTGFRSYNPVQKSLPQNNHHNMEFDNRFADTYFNGPKAVNYTQDLHQISRQLPYASSEERSTAGRPPHALVAFGFGGKLIVMKDQSILCTEPAYASQDSAAGLISVLNVIELAMPNSDGSNVGVGSCDYFRPLCQQTFPGPLVSGNVGSREVNRWIDDRIVNCTTPDADYRKGEVLKMLFSLLKIACQYYGRLRSAFGSDLASKENDCPESALAKLFASVKRNAAQLSAVSPCLQNMPSQGQIQATAEEVQMLLVSGRKMEALQCAQEGHLWGLAIVIAALLGDKFYGETVKQMALQQLVAGSPVRTLCLLLAGQPAEVFSNSITSNQQCGDVSQPSQVGPSCMLDDWEENLAIISANRTKGDELVITHLGDCLWRERGEVTAAHICYMVAESNIESYSESARLCLVGADHLKYPRTYASPEAIQRTELYEYAKVLGNSQFILLPFQPYKLLYAYMLAEVGKLADSLKYCQAALKSMKAGRSPEVDACRLMVSSLEVRIKIHQQAGYSTNLAPAKLVGRLLNFFDNTAHRVVGGLPPPIPSASHANGPQNELDHQSRGQRVSTSQSTMAMSSLMPSASVEGSNRKSLHNRSVSEPNICRTPRKVESPEKSSSTSPRDNTSEKSRFGRIGSQIFQKTVGLMLKSRSDRQAKLGDKNKFYYDEKLKRWVEEGVQPPAEEAAFAPPPTTAAFMNGISDHDQKDDSMNRMIHANGSMEFKNLNFVEKSAGTPPFSSGSNHFSAGGRMGVRARYVDTFNKGSGTQANSFHSPSPSVKAMKPATSNAKFFIPAPVAAGQETDSNHSSPGTVIADEDSIMSDGCPSFSSPNVLMPPTFLRNRSMGSMDGIQNMGMGSMINGNGGIAPHSRRTVSWGGGSGDPANHFGMGETRPLGEALGFPPYLYRTSSASSTSYPSPFTTVAEDLQEVEL